DVAPVVSALQTQVMRDFAPTWGIAAQLRLTTQPEVEEELLCLFDDDSQAGALGYPARSADGRPCGFVFAKACREQGVDWRTALSHELLEMLADPLVNLAAQGVYHDHDVLFALEVCDPVAGETYDITGVPVADFVLPSWFVSGSIDDQVLVDYLGRLADPLTLAPTGHASSFLPPRPRPRA